MRTRFPFILLACAALAAAQDGAAKFWSPQKASPAAHATPWPSMAGYDGNELADIVVFLKWAATGSSKTVTVEEVETTQ